jgi:hypothetical protein
VITVAMIRPRDKSGRIFLLVIGSLSTYRVIGWTSGDEVRRDEFKGRDA